MAENPFDLSGDPYRLQRLSWDMGYEAGAKDNLRRLVKLLEDNLTRLVKLLEEDAR